MDRNEAEILLRKFYRGETSLEEEKALHSYFSSGVDISPEFSADKALFDMYAGASHSFISEKELEDMIDDMETDIPHSNIVHLSRHNFYRFAAIAASVVILLAAYMGYHYTQTDKNTAVLTDTYKGNPVMAYAETKRVLVYVSQQFNRGTNQLSSISKLYEPANQLKNLNKLNEGLDKLKLIDQLNENTENK